MNVPITVTQALSSVLLPFLSGEETYPEGQTSFLCMSLVKLSYPVPLSPG